VPQHRFTLVFLALSQADTDILSQVGGNLLAELVNILTVNSLGVVEGSVDNTSVEGEKVLGNLRGTWIFRVERSDKGGLLAVIVELEVNRSHREDSTLKSVQFTSDFWILTSPNETILEDVAKLQVLAIYQSKKFSSTGVDVRGIDAAGLEEA
jgi:hypothetical protein